MNSSVEDIETAKTGVKVQDEIQRYDSGAVGRRTRNSWVVMYKMANTVDTLKAVWAKNRWGGGKAGQNKAPLHRSEGRIALHRY